MKKTIIKWSFILATVAFVGTLPSCYTQNYYVPPHVQVPSHQEKGDLDLNAQGLANGSLSISYAATNNLFIGGSISGYNDGDTADHFRVTQLEGGYYYNSPESNFNISVAAGAGAGNVGDRGNDFDVNFSRVYIQPSISYISEKRNLENHFSFRYSKNYYEDQPNRKNGPIPSFDVTYFEPTYTVRVGSPNVRFHAQLGLALNLTPDDQEPAEYIDFPIIIGFGVHANLNVLNMLNK